MAWPDRRCVSVCVECVWVNERLCKVLCPILVGCSPFIILPFTISTKRTRRGVCVGVTEQRENRWLLCAFAMKLDVLPYLVSSGRLLFVSMLLLLLLNERFLVGFHFGLYTFRHHTFTHQKPAGDSASSGAVMHLSPAFISSLWLVFEGARLLGYKMSRWPEWLNDWRMLYLSP